MGDGQSSPCLLVPMVKRRKVSAIRDFPKGLKQLSDVIDLKLRTGQACGSHNKYLKGTGLDQFRKECRIVDSKEKGVHQLGARRKVGVVISENQFGTEQQSSNGDKNKISASKEKPLYQNFGDISSSDVTNIGVKSWREEQKPDSEQDVDHCSCLERQCNSANGNVLTSKESLKCQDIDSSFNACNLTGVTGNMHRTFPKRRKVSAVRDYPSALVRITLSSGPSGKELPIDNVASTNHLGMFEGSSSNDKITVEPSYRISDDEIDGQSSPPDEPSLNMEKREFYHPGSHNSAAINDVQESACQLDGPDGLFYRAPIDTPNFFPDDSYNGFIFEDDV